MHLGILGVKGDAGKASPAKLDGSTGHWALGKVTSVVQWFDHDSSSGGLETNLDVSGAFPLLCHIKCICNSNSSGTCVAFYFLN